ncbi:MAG: methyltransferase domain-containing protein, partial [Deltaproteobacteria bacterium]|nr:methyltransferase domain-containing protein [Deltaproteobacteria bacterium]
MSNHASMSTEPERTVAERWEAVTNSPESVYKSVVVPAQKIRHFAESAYVRPIVEATEPGALCLETGCGSGSLSLAVASTGRRVVTIDIAQGVLDNLAANRARLAAEFPGMGDITPVRGDIEHMPFDDGAFDAVFSEGVIEHWTDKPARLAVMREMVRVLKPGGRLVLFVPNGRHPLHGWWQLTRYPGYASEN